MRGYFDDEEADRETPVERGRDTDLTLGTVAQLGIVFGLLLVCGLSFWLGYAVGHHGSATPPTTSATQPAAPTAAPDQEPLQGNGSIPKPSADAQAPAPSVSPVNDGATTPDGDGGANPATPSTPKAGQNSSPTSSPATAPAAAAPTQPQSPVRPAFPAAGNGSPGGAPAAAPAVRPALPGNAGQFMVQIAAVSHADDANVLVNALRKRGYTATAQRAPSDGLIHVRIGPFATHEEANRMCTRLLDDGYNAMVQP